jgi:hypothetical protein
MKYPKGPYRTTVEIDGVEYDNVAVHYSLTEDEPDTGMAEGVELFLACIIA